jgi:abortive infection bacteriophage resistance protein
MKKATTIDEQIVIIQDRGMIFDEGIEKAKEVLSDIGYFRMGFYCFPFENGYPSTKNRTHKYKEDSKFSDVIKLYYFDVDLRNILLKYLNRIEINFRTNVTYTVSNKYIDSNRWFVHPKVMTRSYIDSFDVKVYNGNLKKNKVIRLHHKKYKTDVYAPAWKTLEFITFGGIVTLFKNIIDKDVKSEIAAMYNVGSLITFENYLDSIVAIRNVCAHGAALFDFNLRDSIANGPALKIDNSNKHNLNSVIEVIVFILDKISTNRANDIKTELKTLFNNHLDNLKIKEIIQTEIGYIY